MKKYMFLVIIILLVSLLNAVQFRNVAVAILPFEKLTDRTDYDWVGHGFSETLSSGLLGFDEIKLVERYRLNTVLDEIRLSQSGLVQEETAKEAGNLTGADFIAFGSYQINNNRIRVNCRVIDVSSGEIIVAIKLTDRFENIFEIQDSLITVLLSNIGGSSLLKRKKKVIDIETPDIKAYEWAIKGNLKLDKSDFSTAAEYFEKSLEYDDDYTRARDGINYAYFPMAVGNEWYYKAKIISKELTSEIKFTRKIIGKEIINGKPCLIEELRGDTNIGDIELYAKQYYSYNENGITLNKHEYRDFYGIQEMECGYQLWKFPIIKGDSWESMILANGTLNKVIMHVGEIEETITVPAGTFKCIKVYGEIEAGGIYPIKSYFSYWLNSGVGTIKNEAKTVIDIQGKTETSLMSGELLKFKINAYTNRNKIVRIKTSDNFNISKHINNRNHLSKDNSIFDNHPVFLEIQNILKKYVLVYQPKDYILLECDKYEIIRFDSKTLDNKYEVIGNATVVKIHEDKVALEYNITKKGLNIKAGDRIRIELK